MINHNTKKLVQSVHDYKYGKNLVTYIYESGDFYERQTWHDYSLVQTVTWKKGEYPPAHWEKLAS